MQTINGIHRKAAEEPVLEHGPGAAAPFLGWLEDEVNGAGKVAGAGEMAGRGEQHDGVAIMAAGMHGVGCL